MGKPFERWRVMANLTFHPDQPDWVVPGQVYFGVLDQGCVRLFEKAQGGEVCTVAVNAVEGIRDGEG